MDNYIQIDIKTFTKEELEILMAELSEINFYAFEENENLLSAFIIEKDFNQDEFDKILLQRKMPYEKSIIKNINWNAKWESEFEPIIIEDFVAVRASFHLPVKNVKHEIIITPKMSFGTGHHATTYLMLEQMEWIDFKDKTVLDFGTGTGILAILAKKLGAKKVTAIDNDEWCIKNATENFLLNNCCGIDLYQKDDLNDLDKFDIILANINFNIISKNVKPFNNLTQQSSILLLSGFLKSDEHVLSEKLSANQFKCIGIKNKNEWLMMLLTKQLS